ncbi:ATP-dependent Clp protease proteolytic subunit 6, chloroplastic [Capsicum annuum]|uniref:ATP-dependent Clp protease proteolytic subunit n=1 Tax=Capsicum annuum TaxID=4072 RepID=A0A2G2YSS5_CAPAN|nr:ATP-dependent Clp protease proteolytic subunit 6, chloroplastic [Capsicum annuum]
MALLVKTIANAIRPHCGDGQNHVCPFPVDHRDITASLQEAKSHSVRHRDGTASRQGPDETTSLDFVVFLPSSMSLVFTFIGFYIKLIQLFGTVIAILRNRYDVIEAKEGVSNSPIMPVVITPGGILDLSSVLFRNWIFFIGILINSAVSKKVILQLATLETIDENTNVLIKPKVGTVCFGVAASQGALFLSDGEKGMRVTIKYNQSTTGFIPISLQVCTTNSLPKPLDKGSAKLSLDFTY